MYQVFVTTELRRLGLSDREIRAAVGCCLERIARGRFAVKGTCADPGHAKIWTPLADGDVDELAWLGDKRDAIERVKILIRTRADLVNRRAEENSEAKGEVFSHLSAALLWQLEVVEIPHSRAEVIRSHTSGRFTHLIVRRRELCDEHVELLGDTTVTSKARTLIDTARDYALDVSLPMLDDALRRQLVTKDQLRKAVDTCHENRCCRRVETALGLADGHRESPGESIVAVRLYEVGLNGFEPQVEIFDENGFFVARTDFTHRDSKTIIEFDGRAKYTLDGRDHRREFDRERERERRLRALGYHVIRVFWKDLWRRQTFTDIERIVRSRTQRRATGS
ncbi:hypothetical protein [Brevibacterium oceani]|uniref:hypothetical protein n=1 Tax=Brevibacterium oceani TaxID=358099 RepID=UPI0015E6928E|nr:hypothetical protein [Brevibacterium oceani]